MNTILILKDELDRGVREPTHKSVEQVSIWLLRTRGYDFTYSWIKRIYGSDFRPEDTKEQLRKIVDQQDLDHISIPK